MRRVSASMKESWPEWQVERVKSSRLEDPIQRMVFIAFQHV
jgi:hypothetical protein